MNALVTAERLRRLAPKADPKLVAAIVDGWPAMVAAGIETPRRVATFLATLATETGGFRALSENLNYTSVAQIRKTWPKRFPTDASAKPFVRNPEALANKVYGGRLGNTEPGDGWRFRGGGFIQNTGRANYRAAGHENDPETLRTPGPGFAAAVTFWADNGLNALADRDDPKAVRKRVNGGLIGFDDFAAYLHKAKRIFVAVDRMGLPLDLPVTAEPQRLPQPVTKPLDASWAATAEPTYEAILAAQTRLKALGYHGVGKLDGIWGSKTREALNGFRADHGLPLSEEAAITPADMAALMTAAPRPVDPDRAEGIPDSEIVGKGRAAQATGAVGAGLGAIAGVGAVADRLAGPASAVSQLLEKLDPVASALGAWWPAFLVAGGVAVFFLARRMTRVEVDAYRAGEFT